MLGLRDSKTVKVYNYDSSGRTRLCFLGKYSEAQHVIGVFRQSSTRYFVEWL